MSIFAIDPGLSVKPGGTGWAYWKDEKILMPTFTGVIYPIGDTWEKRVDSIISHIVLNILYKHLYQDKTCRIGIEFPTFFQSAKGMTCATGKDGGDSDLVKLAFLTGKLHGFFHLHGFPYIELIRVNEWKKTLSDDLVEKRVYRRLKTEFKPIHTTCAVGIGLYMLNHFHANSEEEEKIGVKKIPSKKVRVISKSSTQSMG